MFEEVPSLFKNALKKSIQNLADGLAGVKTVVVCSVDGFILNAADSINFSKTDLDKLAAISSSMSAIAAMAIKEVGAGVKYGVISIESDEGYVILVEVPHPKLPLIMCLVASKKAIYGQALYKMRLAVSEICDIKF